MTTSASVALLVLLLYNCISVSRASVLTTIFFQTRILLLASYLHCFSFLLNFIYAKPYCDINILPVYNNVFFGHQKLEWEYLSIDLLPHPDMFADAHFASSQEGSSVKDDDGAKRSFFGGERFIEGISGEAYVMQFNGLS